MSDMFHMYSYLVSTPRLEVALQECGILESTQHPVMSNGVFCQRVFVGVEDAELHSVFRISSQCSVDGAGVFLHYAPYQSIIGSLRSLVLELFAQERLCLFVFGYEQQPRGVFIDTVYEPHTRIIDVEFGIVSQIPGDGVEQRAVEVAHTGVYHHIGCFVDDHNIVVFEYYRERYVLRYYRVVARRRLERYYYLVEWLDAITRFYGLSVDSDKAKIRSILKSCTRDPAQQIGQIFVDTYKSLTFVYYDTVMFVQFGLGVFVRIILVILGIVFIVFCHFFSVNSISEANRSPLNILLWKHQLPFWSSYLIVML